MKYVIVSLDKDKIRRTIQILGRHYHDIDTEDPDFSIKILRDDGLLLFDNDNNMIKVNYPRLKAGACSSEYGARVD